MTINREHLAGLELARTAFRELLSTCSGVYGKQLDDMIAQAQAAPEAEPVEVVAYRGKDRDGGQGFAGARWPNAFGQDCTVEPLMTVAQHQRILSAATHAAGQVVDGVPSATALRRARLFLDGLGHDSCNEVKTLRALLDGVQS